mgnify:CR=1 FL=1
MKRTYFFVLMLAIILLFLYFLQGCSNPRSRVQENKDSIENVEKEQPKISDILQLREELRLAKYTDSVYLAMPEQILISILVTEGTNKSIKDIVKTYIANKSFYDQVIKKNMDIQKQYIPDSIPKSLIPQEHLDSLPIKQGKYVQKI